MKEFNPGKLLTDFYVLTDAERARLLVELGSERTARDRHQFDSWYKGVQENHNAFYSSLEAKILEKEKKGERLTPEDMLLLYGLRYCATGCYSEHDEVILPFIFDAGSLFTSLLIKHSNFYRGVLAIQEELDGLKRTQEPFGITLNWRELTGLDGNDYPEYEYKDKSFENLSLNDWYFKHTPSDSNPEHSSQSLELHVSGAEIKPVIELPLSDYDSLALRIYSKMPKKLGHERKMLP